MMTRALRGFLIVSVWASIAVFVLYVYAIIGQLCAWALSLLGLH